MSARVEGIDRLDLVDLITLYMRDVLGPRMDQLGVSAVTIKVGQDRALQPVLHHGLPATEPEYRAVAVSVTRIYTELGSVAAFVYQKSTRSDWPAGSWELLSAKFSVL